MKKVYIVKLVSGEEWIAAIEEEEIDKINSGEYNKNVVMINKPFGVAPNPEKREHPEDASLSNFIIYPISVAKTDGVVSVFNTSINFISPAQDAMANVYAQNTGMLVTSKPDLLVQ